MNRPTTDIRDKKPIYRVTITGFGLITPLGTSAWQTFSNLCEGKTLAQRARALPSDINLVDLVRATGAVASCQHTATDPSIELAERAIREAAAMAGIETTGMDAFLGASKGAVHALSAAAEARQPDLPASALRPTPPADADLAVALGPHGYQNYHLQKRLKLNRVRHHVAACASSLTALHHARQHLLDAPPSSEPRTPIPDPRDHVIVATSEASLLPLFIHSYKRLGVLAPSTPDAYDERPMDRSRQGFMLSECGAAVILKRVPIDAPDDEPLPGEVEMIDTALACEAHDLIRPSDTMPALRHITEQLFYGRTIDMLHPHAPGTPDHDPAELNVYAETLKRLGHTTLPDVYACKGAIGHGLGAAGLSALVLACLCAKARKRPAMPWLTDPIDSALPLKPQASPLKPSTTHAIFAAGFAGHTAGAVVRHY